MWQGTVGLEGGDEVSEDEDLRVDLRRSVLYESLRMESQMRHGNVRNTDLEPL